MSELPVTRWIEDLKAGQEDAAQELWGQYFEKLVRVARKKMGSAPRRVVDEEDIALSAFQSLCRRAADGKFEKLSDRDDLWQLLVAIARHKVVDQIRRQTSLKRGGGNVRGDSIVPVKKDGGVAGFEQFLSEDPSPEFLAVMEEEQQRLFGELRDDTVRSVARLRMDGYANEEIAKQLDVSLRTVERKLNLIRQAWSEELT